MCTHKVSTQVNRLRDRQTDKHTYTQTKERPQHTETHTHTQGETSLETGCAGLVSPSAHQRYSIPDTLLAPTEHTLWDVYSMGTEHGGYTHECGLE